MKKLVLSRREQILVGNSFSYFLKHFPEITKKLGMARRSQKNTMVYENKGKALRARLVDSLGAGAGEDHPGRFSRAFFSCDRDVCEDARCSPSCPSHSSTTRPPALDSPVSTHESSPYPRRAVLVWTDRRLSAQPMPASPLHSGQASRRCATVASPRTPLRSV